MPKPSASVPDISLQCPKCTQSSGAISSRLTNGTGTAQPAGSRSLKPLVMGEVCTAPYVKHAACASGSLHSSYSRAVVWG